MKKSYLLIKLIVELKSLLESSMKLILGNLFALLGMLRKLETGKTLKRVKWNGQKIMFGCLNPWKLKVSQICVTNMFWWIIKPKFGKRVKIDWLISHYFQTNPLQIFWMKLISLENKKPNKLLSRRNLKRLIYSMNGRHFK